MPYYSTGATGTMATLIQAMEADTRLRNARTLDLLSSKGAVGTTDMIEMNWNVIRTDSTSVGATFATGGSDQTVGDAVRATLPIGGFKIYHQFSVSRVDMKDAARRGSEQLRRLFQMNLSAGVLSIRKQINSFLFSGTGVAGTGGIIGFNSVTDHTAAYAGIPYAIYSTAAGGGWDAIRDRDGATTTARALSRSLLYTLDTNRDIYEATYDSIVMHPQTLQKYTELFDTSSATIPAVQVQVPLGYNRDLAPGTKLYNGVPITSDASAPLNQMLFFDSNYVKLVSMDLSNADQGSLTSMGQKDNFETIASADLGGLKLNVALIPQSNPGTIQFQIFAICQLKVENRKYVQVLKELSL